MSGFFVTFHRDGRVSLANRVVGHVEKTGTRSWNWRAAGSEHWVGPFKRLRDVRPLARVEHKRLIAAVHGHRLQV